jgi:hypothetical protein
MQITDVCSMREIISLFSRSIIQTNCIQTRQVPFIFVLLEPGQCEVLAAPSQIVIGVYNTVRTREDKQLQVRDLMKQRIRFTGFFHMM